MKIFDTRPVTVILDKLSDLEKPYTDRDLIMDKLGVDRNTLLGESVRYALLYGKNTNYIGLEAPLDVINENISNVIDVDVNPADDNFGKNENDVELLKAVDKLTDRALTLTAEGIVNFHSMISEIPSLIQMHENLKAQYGKDFELDLKDVVKDKDLDVLKVTLDLRIGIL